MTIPAQFRFIPSVATILIAYFALFSSAHAQKTYRCGNTYSQTPCAGGVAVDTQDARTEAQKNQADSTTTRLNAAQKALEKERLARETREAAQAAKKAEKPSVTIVKSSPIKAKKAKKPKVDAAEKPKLKPLPVVSPKKAKKPTPKN